MSNTNSICQKYPVAPLVLRLLSEWSPSTIFRLVFAMWPCQIFTDRFSTASWNVDDAERRVQHRSWRGKRILTCVYLYLWFQRGETFSNWIRLVWKSFLPERIKSFVCLCFKQYITFSLYLALCHCSLLSLCDLLKHGEKHQYILVFSVSLTLIQSLVPIKQVELEAHLSSCFLLWPYTSLTYLIYTMKHNYQFLVRSYISYLIQKNNKIIALLQLIQDVSDEWTSSLAASSWQKDVQEQHVCVFMSVFTERPEMCCFLLLVSDVRFLENIKSC